MRDALVKRLRDVALDIDFPSTTTLPSSVIRQAADHMEAQAARIAALEAERDKLREALDKLASAAIPIFTDEAGLVHFDAHPRSVDLWDATADARAALAETEGE